MYYHDLDPVIFNIGALSIHWYSLMYVIGFFVGGRLLNLMAQKGYSPMTKPQVDSFLVYVMTGMIIGARFIFVAVYDWPRYQGHPLDIIKIWEGGLSFHGALIGIAIATLIFCRRNKLTFGSVSDAATLAACPGLFLGRVGNFINGELFGRVTGGDWGVVFPQGGPYPRHPSQLYEGTLEGLLLGFILYLFMRKSRYQGAGFSVFIIGYAVIRFGVEFFREADSQLGYYFGNILTMGQILCLLMLCLGICLLTYFRRKNASRDYGHSNML